ncbi:hemerythrin domain-containing protein [uncultured Brevundimonas sp.]|uniref:hemerythrin domain-containing protein n=1 Tax=uncultured Brevundimonas sp. TaxID=213418 RepID=UPI0030EE5760
MSETPGQTLAERTGLPSDLLYLREGFPRDRWTTALHPTAAHWLQMHAGFREHQAHMTGLAGQWRNRTLDPAGLHRVLIPALQAFLQHLDGHHRIETGHYFPAMRKLEPRIIPGLDLLDRDHDDIHGHLETLFQSGLGFHQAVSGKALDVADQADRLADVLDVITSPLLRHLDDEEDIVIPLIALHGDPAG